MRILVIIAALVVGMFVRTDVALADEIFKAWLSGDQELPAVDTSTTGLVKIRINDTATAGEFTLTVNDGVRAQQAHIHCGLPTENGPVVVFLAGFHNLGWDVDGEWVSNATFTDANMASRTSACGRTLGEFIQAMRDGKTYANVHTVAHPAGEIRGLVQLIQ
jgi:hypothetical protein